MGIGNINWGLGNVGKRVFLWQYDNAVRLNQILKNEIDFYGENISSFVSDWQKDVFDLRTANSFGIIVWGKILGVKRPIVTPQNYSIDTSDTLRLFNPNTSLWHSIWISGNMPALNIATTGERPKFNAITINDETFRKCLLAKLYLLYSNASIHDINEYLHRLFPHLNSYVRETGNMEMTITFRNCVPTDTDLTIITSNDFSPRPVGVLSNIGVEFIDENTFSFQEMTIEDMNNRIAYQNSLSTWGTNTSTEQQIASGLGTFYNL